MKSLYKYLIVTLSLGILGACNQFNQDSKQNVATISSSSSSESVLSEASILDEYTVPELSELEQELRASENVKLGTMVFQSDSEFVQSQQGFDIFVDRLRVYRVDEVSKDWQQEFGFDSDSGALVLLKVRIANRSNQTMYFPIEELKLSYDDSVTNTVPNLTLYQAPTGNLTDKLLSNQGEILKNETVEGYIVYGVGKKEFRDMMGLGTFYLTVTPPRESLTEIIGVEKNKLGQQMNLYLPLKESVAKELSQNKAYIQDRLTTEWWGTKHPLAIEALSETQRQDDVKVLLTRVEISDFVPRAKYEESFQNFVFGQVIVSIEYEVTNYGDVAILPIDGDANLVIADDIIYSDYVLINQTYGQEVGKGESYKVIKTFALDKKRYQMVWQDQPILIQLEIPKVFTEQGSNVPISNGEEIQSNETELLPYHIEFEWQPHLTHYINENMERISSFLYQNRESVESQSESSNSSSER